MGIDKTLTGRTGGNSMIFSEPKTWKFSADPNNIDQH